MVSLWPISATSAYPLLPSQVVSICKLQRLALYWFHVPRLCCSDWHSTGSMCPDCNLLTYHLNLFRRNRHCYIFVKYIIKNCDVHYKLQWKPWNGGLLRWYECETGPPCRWLGAGSAAACVMWVGCGWRWIALAGTSGFLWTGLGVDSVVSIYSRTVGL